MPSKSIPLTSIKLDQLKIGGGKSIVDLSTEGRVLLVFLRHLTCRYCLESLNDLSKLKEEFEKEGVRLVLIHMEPKNVAQQYLEKFNLEEVIFLSDPSRYWYQRFGLEQGSFSQIYNFRNMFRRPTKEISLESLGYEVDVDKKQMPGIFVIEDGLIIKSYYHKYVSDRPDYLSLIRSKN